VGTDWLWADDDVNGCGGILRSKLKFIKEKKIPSSPSLTPSEANAR
jgi:hypothetical protein